MMLLSQNRGSFIYRTINIVILISFVTSLILPPNRAYAQSMAVIPATGLPTPGVMISPSAVFHPAVIKGIRIFPDNPLRFDFIVDTGESGLKDEPLRNESNKLIKYFLASLTVPEEDLWVNLSPYEKERIVPQAFGVTEMGRDLLAQDYLLKQLTASLMYPENDLGAEFWDRVKSAVVSRQSSESEDRRLKTEDLIQTFNKVWIVPQKAVVYENKDTAFVIESRLKVMLEEDYVALQRSGSGLGSGDSGNLSESQATSHSNRLKTED